MRPTSRPWVVTWCGGSVSAASPSSISSAALMGACTCSRSTRASRSGTIRPRSRASTSRRSCTATWPGWPDLRCDPPGRGCVGASRGRRRRGTRERRHVRRLARLGAAQRSLARIRLGRPAAPRRRRTVAPRIATGITDPSWPRQDASATGVGPRAMSTTLAPAHVPRPASLAAAPAECGPMVNPVVRWALYLFVFSIPFEMPQRSIPLETTTITAALFLLTTPLESRACYGRIPSALLWFGGWLWVFVIAALVGSQQYAQLALQLLAQLGELLLLCWAAGNVMRDRRVFRT